jgi:transposase
VQKLGQNLSEMSQKEYERHLERQLCWICHRPTHQSHRHQRQCPLCRRKWSYHRRTAEWKLMLAFCQRENPHHASGRLRIAYGTARNHFNRFKRAIRHAGEEEF